MKEQFKPYPTFLLLYICCPSAGFEKSALNLKDPFLFLQAFGEVTGVWIT